MVDDRRDTVVVEKEKSSPIGWIIGLVVFLIVLALFFMYGGFSMFGGGDITPDGSNTINVETPDNVNVQPSGNQ
jgi:hypothetical protein